MNRRTTLAFAVLLALPVALTAADTVPPPMQRKAALALAEKLVLPKPVVPLPAVVKDPFNPFAFKDIPPDASAGSSSDSAISTPVAAPKMLPDRELIEAIADNIKPSGTIVLGGESLLLFGGQTRRKVGESIFGVYAKDGKTYELTISAIQSDSFTLRYHGEETTRPISKRK